MAELQVERRPVLLCVYDATLPEPLRAKRPTGPPFAAAFVLAPERGARALARIEVGHHADAAAGEDERPLTEALRPLAAANPAARSLRLLEHLARGTAARISAPLLDGRVDIAVAPCPR